MKYESTILKRLIDTYGVVGNPRYISEIIKEFIVRGKERFPELFTYQADWLAHIDEFGLNPTYTVSYTGQSIYAPNTLERPVKSATLKGSTKYRDIDTGDILDTFDETKNLELVSVKMPVLKTTGKNLYPFDDINFMPTNLNTWYMSNGVSQSRWGKALTHDCGIGEWFYLEEGRYSISSETSHDSTFQIIGEGEVIKTMGDNMTYQSGWYTFRLKSKTDTLERIQISKIQIEKCMKKTDYEPYKSNILTVNEEVELRGIGEGSNRVEDELDCLTGQVIERIGEIVLDGSEEWVENGFGSMRYYCQKYTDGKSQSLKVLSDKIPTGSKATTLALMNLTTTGKIQLITNFSTVNELKEWLSQNPITVQYELATPVIKTIDLTILDQNGQNVKQLMSFKGGTHFNTRSSEGSTHPSVSVSVETDLEETLKMCSLDGNTM